MEEYTFTWFCSSCDNPLPGAADAIFTVQGQTEDEANANALKQATKVLHDPFRGMCGSDDYVRVWRTKAPLQESPN